MHKECLMQIDVESTDKVKLIRPPSLLFQFKVSQSQSYSQNQRRSFKRTLKGLRFQEVLKASE
jgi:hypothetical protein